MRAVLLDIDGVLTVSWKPLPGVVVLGGAGPEFGYDALNIVFGHLQRGAELVAMHRNLFWRTDAGLQLDSGAFLLGLERAAGVKAVVVGKLPPSSSPPRCGTSTHLPRLR